MAKKRSLFGDGGSLLEEALYGLATGFGASGYDPASRMRRQDDLAKEQQNNQFKNRDFALRERLANAKTQGTPLPPEVMVDIPGMASDVSGTPQNPVISPQDGIVDALARAPVQGQEPVARALQSGLFGGPLGGAGLTEQPLFSDNRALPASGMLPPPVRSPLDSAHDYMTEVRKLSLNQRGKEKVNRLQGMLDAAESPTVRPGAREELLQRLHQEKDRMRVEEDVDVPPTVQDEMATRVSVSPNGVGQIVQPDGRIDVKDMTSKAELERLNLEHQEKTQIGQYQAQAKEQRRQQQIEISRQEVEQKKQAEKEYNDRFRAHYDAEIKAKPYSEQYDAARDDLESQYKALNPKLPMRKFSPKEIQAYTDSKIRMNFDAKDRFLNPGANARKKTPEEAVGERMRSDKEGFKELYDEVQKRLVSANYGEPVDPQLVFETIVDESPEALESAYDQFLESRKRPSTSPLMRAMFGGASSPQSPQQSLMDSFANGQQATQANAGASPLIRSMFGGAKKTPDENVPMPSSGSPAYGMVDAGEEPVSPSDAPMDVAPDNPLRSGNAPSQRPYTPSPGTLSPQETDAQKKLMSLPAEKRVEELLKYHPETKGKTLSEVLDNPASKAEYERLVASGAMKQGNYKQDAISILDDQLTEHFGIGSQRRAFVGMNVSDVNDPETKKMVESLPRPKSFDEAKKLDSGYFVDPNGVIRLVR